MCTCEIERQERIPTRDYNSRLRRKPKNPSNNAITPTPSPTGAVPEAGTVHENPPPSRTSSIGGGAASSGASGGTSGVGSVSSVGVWHVPISWVDDVHSRSAGQVFPFSPRHPLEQIPFVWHTIPLVWVSPQSSSRLDGLS